MPKLLIIADDLTGAADTGARLAGQGVATFLVVDASAGWPDAADECQALVVNTESRHLGAEEAARRVTSAASRGAALGVTHFYKKTDSTLRGNVGAELEALRVAAGRDWLPYLPAYPRLGRTTSGGTLFVAGRPLRETAFASDPLAPVADSFVPSIIAAQTRTPCLVFHPSTLSGATGATAGGAICLIDAETDDDLRRAGDVLKGLGMLKATAGSAGFAEHLPRLLGIGTRRREAPRAGGPMLVAAGSLNEVALSQLSHAESHKFTSVTLPPAVLASEGGADTPEGRAAVGEVLNHARAGRDVIVRTVGESGDYGPYLERAHSEGVGRRDSHGLAARNLAAVIRSSVEGHAFGVLTVLGGDTLLAVARALGWVALLPRGEVLPGVAVSEAAGGAGGPLVVSKAGGFGEADVLSKVRELLRGGVE